MDILKNKKLKDENGMALIVALLVSAIVLSIGLNIANIAAKQIILSSFNKESHKAIFMADAALECALYWDNTTDFNTLNLSGRDGDSDYFFSNPLDASAASNEDVVCFDGWTIPRNDPDGPGPNTGRNANSGTIQFDLKQGGGNDSLPCATVILTKTLIAPGAVVTTLKTLGYNTCDTNNPRRVERGLEIEY